MTATDEYELLAQMFEPKPDYLSDPVAWFKDKLDMYAWRVQRSIAAALVEHRNVAVPSCHGVGKSYSAAALAAWWIDAHPPGEAFVVTTAPTAAQVSAVLWRYIGQMHRKGNLIGQINRSPFSQWYIGPELVAYGRKPADYEQSAFQGIHAKYVLVVVDEAGGVIKSLFDAVDSLATNQYARVIAIGNPDDPGAHFAKLCKPDSDWHVIQIDGLRTPNMTREAIEGKYPLLQALMEAEQIPYDTEQVPDYLRDELIAPLWIEERLRRWCGLTKTTHLQYVGDELRDLVRRRAAASSLFLAKVRGIFPNDASTGVVPLGWVQLAMNRHDDWLQAGKPEQPGRRVLGVDVAREGDDETVIAKRQGNIVEEIERYARQDTMETADAAAKWLHHPQALAVVDVIGIGAGVLDRLRQMRNDRLVEGEALPFNASANSKRTDAVGEFKFQNDRSAAWWRMRELLDPSRGSTVMLPNDERLLEELVAPKYKVMNGGVIKVESKEEIRKRLGRSTDSADAVIQSFWVDGLAISTGGVVPWGDPGNSDTPGPIRYDGYDPFDYEDATYTNTGGGFW